MRKSLRKQTRAIVDGTGLYAISDYRGMELPFCET